MSRFLKARRWVSEVDYWWVSKALRGRHERRMVLWEGWGVVGQATQTAWGVCEWQREKRTDSQSSLQLPLFSLSFTSQSNLSLWGKLSTVTDISEDAIIIWASINKKKSARICVISENKNFHPSFVQFDHFKIQQITPLSRRMYFADVKFTMKNKLVHYCTRNLSYRFQHKHAGDLHSSNMFSTCLTYTYSKSYISPLGPTGKM